MDSFEVIAEEQFTLIKSKVEKLDTNFAPDLKSLIVHHNGEGVKNIIIDLGETRYCDSSGLSAILVASRLCKGADGTFVLCDLQPMVTKLIEISQLHNVLNIIPTLDEARDFIIMEQVERELGKE